MTSLQKITQKPWCQRKVSESQKSFMVFAYEKKNNKKPDNFQEGWALGRRKTEVYPPKLTFLTFSRQKLSAKKVKDFMWVDMNEFCHPRMGPRSQQRCVFFPWPTHSCLSFVVVSAYTKCNTFTGPKALRGRSLGYLPSNHYQIFKSSFEMQQFSNRSQMSK